MNPYTKLLTRAQAWAYSVEFPRTRLLWRYPKDKLSNGWELKGLRERVATAGLLGWDTVLTTDDTGDLFIYFRKKPADNPF